MRISELTNKEVINLADGARIGIIDECEIVIDEQTGKIGSLLLPTNRWFWQLFREVRSSTIPWATIKRIGKDFVLVDHGQSNQRQFITARRNNL